MNKVIFFLIVFCFFNLSFSQVLKVSAGIDFEHLPNEEQQYLKDFTSIVEDYYNNFAWTEDEYETDIDVNIYIIIETVRKKSFEKIYKAQFQIKSVSGESFYDKEWEFPYQPGYLMEHNQIQFDPICNFLDYYAYMILAGELDTYDLYLGTPFYDTAQDIANRGIQSRYSKGWGTRLKELQKITHINTRPLREAKPDFFEAEYLLRQGNRKEAIKHANKVMDAIEKVVREQPNNKYLRLFFDAHYRTFVEIFKNSSLTLKKLMQYDPNHRDVYKELLNE